MRGLTPAERFYLESALPGSGSEFEWIDNDPQAPWLDEQHERFVRLGWMIRTCRVDNVIEWTTTQRGRVALEADVLVRSMSEGLDR